jgi:hypothetical protein
MSNFSGYIIKNTDVGFVHLSYLNSNIMIIHVQPLVYEELTSDVRTFLPSDCEAKCLCFRLSQIDSAFCLFTNPVSNIDVTCDLDKIQWSG